MDMVPRPYSGASETLRKVQLVSDCFGYGLQPEPGEEIEQRLTVTADGRVFFSGYGYGTGGILVKIRSRRFKIDPDAAEYILQLLQDYFSGTRVAHEVTDAGDWTATFSSAGRKAFRCGGPLCPMDPDLSSISGVIRYHLNMPDLLAFDGESASDRIDKVTVDYHRVTKIKPSVIPEGADWEYATWDYTERLTIDRATDTLEHIQNIGSECQVSRKYHVQERVSSLLDEFDPEGFLCHVQGNPPDAIKQPLETKDYTITIESVYGGERTISGSFDRDGLPSDFPAFIDAVFSFLQFYGMGELFEPSIYAKPLR